MMKLLLLIAALTMGFTASAQGVPNTFSTGDTVSASKINQNFSYLDGKGKRLVLKNNGTIVGQLFPSSSTYTLLTSKGYIMSFPFMNSYNMRGSLGNYIQTNVTLNNSSLYFTSSNCTGDPYTDFYEGSIFYSVKPSPGYYYTPYNSTVYRTANNSIAFNSYYYGPNSCRSIDTSGTDWYVSKVLLNDESITGWPSTIGTLTISYE